MSVPSEPLPARPACLARLCYSTHTHIHVQVEGESSIIQEPKNDLSGKLPHLKITATQPATQESVHRLIAITKDMPDKVRGVPACMGVHAGIYVCKCVCLGVSDAHKCACIYVCLYMYA